MNRKKLGSIIRELRKRRGWTQTELGHAADLSKATVMNLEKGCPSFESTLQSIAKAFGFAEDYFLNLPQNPELVNPSLVEASILIPEDTKMSDSEREAIARLMTDAGRSALRELIQMKAPKKKV